MTATRGAAFTTAVRVIDRVLRDTARQRTLAEPAVAAGLAQVGVLVVGVRHRTHRAHALAADITLFARHETPDPEDADRKSVVYGQSVSVSVELGGGGILKKKN